MCFVQFMNAGIHDMPRVYLATPDEVATCLKAAAGGRGDTVLNENHTWGQRAQAAGTTDKIPDSWVFSCERVHSLSSAA